MVIAVMVGMTTDDMELGVVVGCRMQMFLWNNIFLSLGFDVKDHFKDFGGDAAAYAAPVGVISVAFLLNFLFIVASSKFSDFSIFSSEVVLC